MLELAAPLRAEAEEAPRREPKAGAEGGGRSAGSRAGGAVIQADPRLNAIIVKDKPQNAPIYRALIDLLDVPGNLVEIEAMIVDVATTSLSDLGIDWSAKAGRVSADNSNGGVTLSAALGGAATATSVSNYILARISALESKGSAKVVSRPSIITQDNMGALIDLAQTFYIQSTGERVAQVTPVTVGVTLRVTPRVVTTGGTPSVQLVVDIEDGGIEDIRIGSLPVVTRSTVSTQAMVAETQSLVIGGLNSESNTRNRDGVPGLSSVPVAGALFSRTTASTEKRERLFVITPRVITPVGTAGPPKRPETQASNENAKDPQ
jgi:type III secretion protein C